MTTPRDLLMVALDLQSDHAWEQGDLSLALAAAELIDLMGLRAIRLGGERIVPGRRLRTGDRLLDEAALSLVRQEPYEWVGDWLWRRGRGLFSAQLAAIDAAGQLTRERRRWRLFRPGRTMPVDSPAHREAAERWASGEPVLAALAAVAGIHGERTYHFPDVADVAQATVLAAVNAAVMELGLERQRQEVEEDAFDTSGEAFDAPDQDRRHRARSRRARRGRCPSPARKTPGAGRSRRPSDTPGPSRHVNDLTGR